jgi:cell division protein FtsW (lipid II flippase)
MKTKYHNLIYVVLFLFGFSMTYLINYVGNTNRMQETIAIFSNHCFHIHHWIICFFIIFVLLIGHNIKNKLWLYAIIIFLIGVALEDIMFSDFLKIKDDCHGEKLIQMLKKNPGT